jgi:mxaA protein
MAKIERRPHPRPLSRTAAEGGSEFPHPPPACGRGVGVRVLATAVLALSTAPAPALALQSVEPRAFGYTVGDVLERRVLVDRIRDGTLDPASLPRPGRAGRWFQLRAVTPAPDGVRLLYQLVNAPLQPEQENLPSLALRLIRPDGRVQDAAIGPFTVATAPLMPFGPYDTVQDTDLRPDLDPPPIDTSARRRRVLAYGAALALLAAAQCAPWLARRVGWRPAGPFARARRALTALARRPSEARSAQEGGSEAGRQALRRLHQALDEAAGRTLALDNVEALFGAQPWLAPARAGVERLLVASRDTFFAGAPPPPIAQVRSLVAQLADLERGR